MKPQCVWTLEVPRNQFKPIQTNSPKPIQVSQKKNNPAKFCATGVRDPSEVNLKPISIKMRKSICWQPEDVAEDWYCEHASSMKGKLCDVKRSTVVEDVVDRFGKWLMYLKISEACLIPRRWWGSEKGKWCDAKSRTVVWGRCGTPWWPPGRLLGKSTTDCRVILLTT